MKPTIAMINGTGGTPPSNTISSSSPSSKERVSSDHHGDFLLLSSTFICPTCHFGPSESMVTAHDVVQGKCYPHPPVCRCSMRAGSEFDIGQSPMDSTSLAQPLLLEVEELVDRAALSKVPTSDSIVKKDGKLMFIFIMFVIFGSANVVFGKLSAIPMYNYPNFFNIWICFLFVLLCYTYIIPAVYLFDAIPREQFKLSKRPFAVMGMLDCLSGIMSSFAAVYLPGPLLVLLPQAAIPVSMCFSVVFLNSKYHWWHYLGAMTVITGIVIVLEPLFTNRHLPDYVCVATGQYVDEFCVVCEQQTDMENCLLQHVQDPLTAANPFVTASTAEEGEVRSACSWLPSNEAALDTPVQVFWSFILILANIPKVLSGIYKEKYSERHDVDSVYINAWIAIFQTIFSLALAVPAGYTTSPPVPMTQLPVNFWDGLKCYVGIGSIKDGCHPDQYCELWGPIFSNVFLLVNCIYAVFAILILKHGSANLMFLALTLMVPISNLAFAMPHMPQRSIIHTADVIGLITIMSGLVFYRFGSTATKLFDERGDSKKLSSIESDGLMESLIHEDSGRSDNCI